MNKDKRPNCTEGECVNLTSQYRRKDNSIRYNPRCQRHMRHDPTRPQNLWRRPYLAFKKDHCESCGFVAVVSAQLDVDHIDGNHSNNSPENLRTLCANCHRLKTFLNKENCHNRKDWT